MNKRIFRYFCLSLLLVLTIVIFSVYVGTTEPIVINNEIVTPFNDGWRCFVNGEPIPSRVATLPTDIPADANDVVLIENTLPDDYPEGMTICFRSSTQFVRVFIDDVEIYRYGHDSNIPFGQSPGSAWNFTRLHKATAGSKLSIELISPYDTFSGFVPSIYYGSKNANVFHILEENIVGFFISMIIVFVAILLFVIYLFFRKHTRSDYLLYLAWFALLAGIWSMTEARIAQFSISNQYIIAYLSFFSLMLLPIPLLLFVSETHSLRHKKPFYLICTLLLINFVVMTALQVFNVVDFLESLVCTHILIVLGTLLVIGTVFLEVFVYKNKHIYILGLGTVVFALVSMLDFVQFYGKRQGGNAFYFRFAVLFYILILTYYTVCQLMRIMTQNMRTQMLEQLAFLDLLTNLQNRTAFEKEMEPYRASVERCKKLLIGIFDINNLKLVNDTQGHKAGDDLLIGAVSCLNTVFSPHAKIYRIGGDEFAILSTKLSPAEIPLLVDRFEAEVTRTCNENNMLLSVAYGFAQFNQSIDNNVDGLYVRADGYMYDKKLEIKKK